MHDKQDQNENPFSCAQWYSKSANLRIWSHMKIRTKLKNLSAAPAAPKWKPIQLQSMCLYFVQILLIWSYMKIRTKMKNHSAALNATLNPWIWWSEDTWNQDQNEKKHSAAVNVIINLGMLLYKDTWKSAPKWKILSCLNLWILLI